MSKPIYFNGKFYTGGMNGVHRVADRLIRECDQLLALMPKEQRPAAYLMTSKHADWVPDLKVIQRRNSRRTSQLWEQTILPFDARDGILVNLANLAPLAHLNKVTMIHDVQFMFSDCGYPVRQRVGYRWLAPMLGRSSKATLTVSEFSRRMLQQFSISDAQRTYVIANGADHILEASADDSLRERLGLTALSYVVMFGSGKEYKNNATLFRTFASGAASPIRLVIVGPGREELAAAGLSPPADAVFAGRASDAELRGLLCSALAVLFPSRTEGFGLPPLEAMACGCPAIVSPAGAIPEVCGDAVLYAGTDACEEWSEAIGQLRSNPTLRAYKIAQGFERAAHFTWKRAGSQLMRVIGDVARECAN